MKISFIVSITVNQAPTHEPRACVYFPTEHWQRSDPTTRSLKRLNKEVKRMTEVVAILTRRPSFDWWTRCSLSSTTSGRGGQALLQRRIVGEAGREG